MKFDRIIIPVIKPYKLHTIFDTEGKCINIWYGITKKEDHAAVISLLKPIRKSNNLRFNIFHDCEVNTKIGSMEWSTDNQHPHIIMTFENTEVNDKNRLMPGFLTGYEKVYWISIKL